MKRYLQAAGIWCLMIPLAIINGWLRENVLILLGDMALPLSGLILCACIFVTALLLIPKIKNCKPYDYIVFGAMWFLLTNLFDLSSMILSGGSLLDFLKIYDVTTGNLWIAVVIVSAVSPYLASKQKRNH